MLHGDKTALMAMNMAQAAECERLDAVRRELKDLSLLLRWRREVKYSPEQPRDANGRWMPWEHGEGEGSADGSNGEVNDAFGVAPDGTEVDGVAGIPDDEKNSTVQSFMSKYCNAGIRAEMPGQFLQMPITEVIALAKSGDASARTCLKLLSRGRFQK
jgi:hypothetical protein